ncbi:MAG: hypothetical protein MUC36_18120 [Planctomycetes bacterium]|jgi:hypothetical protein|nr:hypothetical protein [Planctomycetota bacterium]
MTPFGEAHTAPALLVAMALLPVLPCTPVAAQAPSTAPAATEAALRALLQRLDACFERGDVDGYLQVFAPDHPGAHSVLQQHLTRHVAAAPERSRRSALVGSAQSIGPRTVVRVEHSMRLGPAAAPRLELVEHSLLAIDPRPDGSLVPTLATAVPPRWRGSPADQFRCEACNYEVGAAPGWLCAPMPAASARALEGATFYLLGTDLACDLSVEVDPAMPVASTVAQRLGEALQRLEPRARAGAVQPWRPPHHATPVPGLTGAKLQLELPGPGAGDLAQFHVVTFGGLQHILLLRGSSEAMRAQDAAVQRLLASYHLLELDAVRVDAASQTLSHHTGGRLVDGTYQNSVHAVELRGPTGWQPQLRAGGTLFRVCWQSEHGSRLWLTGHGVPVGMTRWDTAAADRWLAELCAQQRIEPAPDAKAPAADAAWLPPDDCGGPTRWLCAVPRQGEPLTAPRRRWIRVRVHDDLLLVVDGFANTEADEQALQTAMRTLRRD